MINPHDYGASRPTTPAERAALRVQAERRETHPPIPPEVLLGLLDDADLYARLTGHDGVMAFRTAEVRRLKEQERALRAEIGVLEAERDEARKKLAEAEQESARA